MIKPCQIFPRAEPKFHPRRAEISPVLRPTKLRQSEDATKSGAHTSFIRALPSFSLVQMGPHKSLSNSMHSNSVPSRCYEQVSSTQSSREATLYTRDLNYNPGQKYVGHSAECNASTSDRFSHGNKRSLDQILPSPPPPCNVVRKERLAEESSNIA